MKQALYYLEQAVMVETRCFGALPGKSLRHIKTAIGIIKKDPMMQKDKLK